MSDFQDYLDQHYQARQDESDMAWLMGDAEPVPMAESPDERLRSRGRETPQPPAPRTHARGGRPRPKTDRPADPMKQPDKPLYEETGEALQALFVRGPIVGLANTAESISDLSVWLAEKTGMGDPEGADPARAIADAIRSLAPEATGDKVDKLAEGLGTFLGPFALVRAATKAPKVLEKAKTFKRRAGEAGITGAITDVFAWDEADKNLATLLNAIPALEPYVPDLLVHGDEYDNPIVWRLQNVLEGAGLGVLAEGLAKGIGMAVKGIGDARRAKEAGIGNEQLATVQRLRDAPPDAKVGDAATREKVEGLRTEIRETLSAQDQKVLDELDGAPKAAEDAADPRQIGDVPLLEGLDEDAIRTDVAGMARADMGDRIAGGKYLKTGKPQKPAGKTALQSDAYKRLAYETLGDSDGGELLRAWTDVTTSDKAMALEKNLTQAGARGERAQREWADYVTEEVMERLRKAKRQPAPDVATPAKTTDAVEQATERLERQKVAFAEQVRALEADLEAGRNEGSDPGLLKELEDELEALKKGGPEAVEPAPLLAKEPMPLREAPAGPQRLTPYEEGQVKRLEESIPTLEGSQKEAAESQLARLKAKAEGTGYEPPGAGLTAKEAADQVEWMMEAIARLEPDKRPDLYAKLDALKLRPEKPKQAEAGTAAPQARTRPESIDATPPAEVERPGLALKEAMPVADTPAGPNLQGIEELATRLRQDLDKSVAAGKTDEALAQTTQRIEEKLQALKDGVPESIPTIARIPRADTAEQADALIAEYTLKAQQGDAGANAHLAEALARKAEIEAQGPKPDPEAEAAEMKALDEGGEAADDVIEPDAEAIAQVKATGEAIAERAQQKAGRPDLTPDVPPDVAPVARGWSQWTHGVGGPQGGKAAWRSKPATEWTRSDSVEAASEAAGRSGGKVEPATVPLDKTADETIARGIKDADTGEVYIPAGTSVRTGDTTFVRIPKEAGPAVRRELVEAASDPKRLPMLDLHVVAEAAASGPRFRYDTPAIPANVPDAPVGGPPALTIDPGMRGSAIQDYVLDKSNLDTMVGGQTATLYEGGQRTYGREALKSVEGMGDTLNRDVGLERLEHMGDWFDILKEQRQQHGKARTMDDQMADAAALERILGPGHDVLRGPLGSKRSGHSRVAVKVLNHSANRVVRLAREAKRMTGEGAILPGKPEMDARVVAYWNAIRAFAQHKALMAAMRGDMAQAYRLMDTVGMRPDAAQHGQIAQAAMRIFERELSTGYGKGDGTDVALRLVDAMSGWTDVAHVHDAPLVIGRQSVGGVKKTLDYVQTMGLGGMVSGPKTHSINVLSNAATNVLALPEAMVEAIVRYGGGRLGGDSISFRDTLAILNAEIVGRASGFKAVPALVRGSLATHGWGKGGRAREALERQGLTDTFRTLHLTSKAETLPGENPTRLFFDEGRPGPESFGALMGRWADKAVQAPFAALGAEDMFFKSLGYHPQLVKSALLQGHAAGKTGADLTAYAKDVLGGLRNDELATRVRAEALERAEELTFTRPFGEDERFAGVIPMAKLIRSLDRIPPVGRLFLIPFINTAGRLSEYFAGRVPGLPLVNPRSKFYADWKAGGARRQQAITRQLTGAAYIYGSYEAFQAGWITGGHHAEHPWSIKLPSGKYMGYKKFMPISGFMMLGAGIGEIVQYANDPKHLDAVSRAAHMAFDNLYDVFLDQTVFGQVNEVSNLIANFGPEALIRFLGSGFGNIPPYSGLTRQIGGAMDPYVREWRVAQGDEPEGIVRAIDRELARIRESIPGLGKDMPPMVDHWGRDVRKTAPDWFPLPNGFWHAASPLELRDASPHPEMDGLLWDIGYHPSTAPAQIDGTPLTDWEHYEYKKLAGGLFEDAMRYETGQGSFDGLRSEGPEGYEEAREIARGIRRGAVRDAGEEMKIQAEVSRAHGTVARVAAQSLENAGRMVRERTPDLNRRILETYQTQWYRAERLAEARRRGAQ